MGGSGGEVGRWLERTVRLSASGERKVLGTDPVADVGPVGFESLHLSHLNTTNYQNKRLILTNAFLCAWPACAARLLAFERNHVVMRPIAAVLELAEHFLGGAQVECTNATERSVALKWNS